MPYKDIKRRRQYDVDYRKAHRERLNEYMRRYREEHEEELRENRQREIYIYRNGGGHIYLGTSGMTRKQRQKFQQELNKHGPIKRP